MRLADKTLAILSLFTVERPAWRLDELAEKSGIPGSTLYRFMQIFGKNGYVVRDSLYSTYRLGPAALRLGRVAEASMDFRILSIPWMEWLREKTGETITLSIRLGNERLCIDNRENKGSGLKYSSQPGEARPLYTGAAGKVLLAFMNPAELKKFLSTTQLIKITRNTITNKNKLMKELADIRSCGYGFSQAEYFYGVWTIATPIFDARGEVQAALSVSGVLIQGRKIPISDRLHYLLEATRDINTKMGYCPSKDKSTSENGKQRSGAHKREKTFDQAIDSVQNGLLAG